MKKLLSIILALVMILSLSVTAFAADNSETNDGADNNPTTIKVYGTYAAGSAAGETISVKIEWDAMNFTYTAGDAGSWDPDSHTYGADGAGSWSTDTANIKVTNNSNVAVTASFSWAATATGVVGKFDGATRKSVNLVSADAEEYQNKEGPSQTVAFGITGSAISADQELGTITVAIAKDDTVKTAAQLEAALAEGGEIKLATDTEITSISVPENTTVTIDLNKNTIETLSIADGANVTIVSSGGLATINEITVGASTLTVNTQVSVTKITLNSSEASIDLSSANLITWYNASNYGTGCKIIATVSGCSTTQFDIYYGYAFSTYLPFFTGDDYTGDLTINTTYYYGMPRLNTIM